MAYFLINTARVDVDDVTVHTQTGQYQGSGSVILLCPKIGLAPQKHDVISMSRQQ